MARGFPNGESGGAQEGGGGGQDRRPSGPGRAPVYAALDLGTNNCRLLIARPMPPHAGPGGFKVIDAFSRIVRLGEGLGQGSRLSDAAVDRTIEALKVCASKMQRRGVTHARSVATEACRRADNGASFLARVTAETGLELEVISAAEEARLAMQSCLPLLDPVIPRALLFDIGGGSTELIWLEVTGPETARLSASISLPIGVVSFAERYGGERVDGPAYDAMIAEVGAALAAFDAVHGIAAAVGQGRVQMLGTSGTVTTIAGVHLDLPRYDRSLVDGIDLSFEVVRATTCRLRGMSYAERAAHPCVGRERADLVIAGLAILEAICLGWRTGRLRVADRGLREGILIGLMNGRRGGSAPMVRSAPLA